MASKFLLAIIALAFLCQCRADLINDVCSKSRNPSLCNQVLRSDPRSGGADLKGLGQIIIEKAQAATQAAIDTAKSVETDMNKEIVETCVETGNDAKDTLNDCKKLLKEGNDKPALNSAASAALTDVSTCDDEFGASEPAKLKQASRKAQDLIGVLLVISNIL